MIDLSPERKEKSKLARKIIDLSIPIDSETPADPPVMKPQIKYTTHRESAGAMASIFPGLRAEDLPENEGWALERVTISTHNGTHMDAPYHFHSTTNYGKDRSPTIDEIPLELCFCPGVKLDFREFADGYVATATDVESELQRINYQLKPYDIVLVNTRAGAAFGRPDYIHTGCGMGREATLYLTKRGVRVVGTDAWSWDAPFSHTAKKWAETGDSSIIWEGHKAGREIPYWQMEKLTNLESLPPFDYIIACFPVKVRAASAGWARVVAIFED